MPLFTRGGAIDEPAVQTVLHNFSQFFQSRRDSLKVVVTERIKKNVFLAFLCVLISKIKVSNKSDESITDMGLISSALS